MFGELGKGLEVAERGDGADAGLAEVAATGLDGECVGRGVGEVGMVAGCAGEAAGAR